MQINSFVSNALSQSGINNSKNINASLEKLEKLSSTQETSKILDIKISISETQDIAKGISSKNITISMLQVTSGSLNDMRDHSLMINELVGNNTQGNDEIQELFSKINTIKNNTTYNGENIFGSSIALRGSDGLQIPNMLDVDQNTNMSAFLKDIESILGSVNSVMQEQEVGLTNLLAALSNKDVSAAELSPQLNKSSIQNAHDLTSLSHKIGTLLS